MANTRKNRASKRSAKTTTRRMARTSSKKVLTNTIKRVLNRQLETKYVAYQEHGIDGGLVVPGNIVPTTDAHSLLPPLAQQTTAATSNTREGDKVEPTRATFNINLWLANDSVDVKTIFVKLYLLTVKSIKNFEEIGASAPDGMFENGAPDPVNWVANSQALQQYYPICKENYTLIKTKTFKFMKNYNIPIGGTANPNVTGTTDRHSFSFSWKPPVLKYAKDDELYPSNYAPVFYAVAYSPGYNVDTVGSLSSSVKMEWQVSLSYKDA